VRTGFRRLVVSEIEAPIILVDLVNGITWTNGRTTRQRDRTLGEDRARYDRLHADTRLRLRQAAADGRPAGAPAPWKRPPAKVGQVTGRLE
jgi:hypothetical protein